MYYIYHIKGKKIGVTRNVQKRVYEQQGIDINNVEILETSKDIDYVSSREIELQRKYGYEIDRYYYKQRMKPLKSRKTMKLNVTESTVTFPCRKEDVGSFLNQFIGSVITTQRGNYIIDEFLADWIKMNAVTSAYRDSRCYVYNDALHKYVNSTAYALRLLEDIDKPSEENSEPIYDSIREWARIRGIYDMGDSKTQYVKLMEEAGELAQAILKKNTAEISDAIGDMVVVLTNLAHLEGLQIEGCIKEAYNVISKRKGTMKNGTFVKSETL
jgi:NTP pyrophosphatase (non-canonical NTP hydrolase)